MESIDISIIANEVEKIEWKDAFKYSLKCNKKVKTLPMKASVKLGGKGEATIASELLNQRLVVLANGCSINFDDCKGCELWL